MAKKLTGASNGKPAKVTLLPVAEGWYDAVIYDLESGAAQTQKNMGTPYWKIKIRITGSLRYRGRTDTIVVMENSEFSRPQIEERFGEDIFQNPEFFLDIAVRVHYELRPDTRSDTELPRVVSIYPKLIRNEQHLLDEAVAS